MRQAEEKVEGSYFQLMASLIYTAFTFEAYLNHVGKQIFGCWDDLESLSPKKKLNVIAEKLRVKVNDAERPFQTIKKLIDFRNDVAHGKTIFLKTAGEIRIMDSKLDDYMHEPLEAEWEKYCTLKNAKRAREDVESIMREFHKASNMGDEDLFFTPAWSSEATLIHEE
ncbi:MAG: hypothetical protein FJ025_05365 [Chloroflexi bacterium]|nr:hypothetical protein [Chloroflexota bacterium]